MKKFIAFYAHCNSGVQSMDKARKWATDALTSTKVNCVYVAEVIETVERSIPPIHIKPFRADVED